MKRILLLAGSAIAFNGAVAAEPATKAQPAPVIAGATTTAAVTADTRVNATTTVDATVKTEETRKELAELRAQMQDLTRRMAALSTQLGESGPRSYAYRYLGNPDSAMIGVVLGMSDGHVVVGALTPDGPAMRAGLKGSDIITAIDHKPIDGKDVIESVDRARGLLRDLRTGQKVTIDYLRDGRKGSVTFAAERREAQNWPLVMSDDPEHPMPPKDFSERMRADVERATKDAEREFARDHARYEKQVERATREAMRREPNQMHVPMPWWGLNLAALNTDLGRYFGADKGVLVLSTDEDSLPGIRAGDVITSVAGKPVTRPEDALRALRDQESGKEVPIRVLRDRKTLALSMKAPTFNSIFNLRVVPPAPPAPVAVPAPAEVPAPAAVPAPPAPEPIASR